MSPSARVPPDLYSIGKDQIVPRAVFGGLKWAGYNSNSNYMATKMSERVREAQATQNEHATREIIVSKTRPGKGILERT